MTLSYRLIQIDTLVLADQQKVKSNCANTGFHLKDVPRAMADRDGLQGRVKRIRTVADDDIFIFLFTEFQCWL